MHAWLWLQRLRFFNARRFYVAHQRVHFFEPFRLFWSGVLFSVLGPFHMILEGVTVFSTVVIVCSMQHAVVSA